MSFARTKSQRDIVRSLRYLVVLPRYRRKIARTKRDIRRISFAFLLHNAASKLSITLANSELYCSEVDKLRVRKTNAHKKVPPVIISTLLNISQLVLQIFLMLIACVTIVTATDVSLSCGRMFSRIFFHFSACVLEHGQG